MQAGMNDYITKPFAPKNLFNKIASFVNAFEHTSSD
jgi:DNA-binding response OmpR family regulator